MANALADYRTDLDGLLATAVDSSTWTTAIKDAALRLALGNLNTQLIYEDDFTVVTTGYEQDLSGITAINSILALAYPWEEGWDFNQRLEAWRLVDHNKVYFTLVEPASGETIRVRYTKLHVIEDLDSALATTVPDAHRQLVGLWAAAYCCDLRVRQVSENPALPLAAAQQLRALSVIFNQRATNILSHVPASKPASWNRYGLD